MAVQVARNESSLVMQQSRHVYTATNAPAGFKAGDREQSFCIFQIHEPAHRTMLERNNLTDFKTNVKSCILAAKLIHDSSGGFYPWTEYHKIIAMR